MSRVNVKKRLYCYFCLKPVSSKLSYEVIVRALVVCPECVEQQKVIVIEDNNGDGVHGPEDYIEEN